MHNCFWCGRIENSNHVFSWRRQIRSHSTKMASFPFFFMATVSMAYRRTSPADIWVNRVAVEDHAQLWESYSPLTALKGNIHCWFVIGRRPTRLAGIYWLTPANNWDGSKALVKSLASQISQILAHGEKGAKRLPYLRLRNIGPYPEQMKLRLVYYSHENWKQYQIDLRERPETHRRGFAFIIRRSDNPRGPIFIWTIFFWRREEKLNYALEETLLSLKLWDVREPNQWVQPSVDKWDSLR